MRLGRQPTLTPERVMSWPSYRRGPSCFSRSSTLDDGVEKSGPPAATGRSVEGDREARRPAEGGQWVPGRGPGAAGVWHPAGDGLQGFGDLEAGQVRAEAVVHARTEGQDRR